MIKLSHEAMMEKAWMLIDQLGITEDREEYQKDIDNFYLVEDIHKVRDAFYSDFENGIDIEDEDLPGFFDRHSIEWQ